MTEADVEHAIRHGELVARQTHGVRGTRYVVRGLGADGRLIEVVCRILPEKVRIVTVYRV